METSALYIDNIVEYLDYLNYKGTIPYVRVYKNYDAKLVSLGTRSKDTTCKLI